MEKVRHPVRPLPPEVARKIAAGEVIDRPNAIVRELLDNAVDSGADTIQVELENGGIDKIRVVDNGMGMSREDLEHCARPHATSKITSETDLMNLSTLGFRGEALSSIAAVSRLQITTAAYGKSWRLKASITEDHLIYPDNLARGTIVQSEALFENFPARRMFLKRPAAEGNLCKQIFVEKALPCPHIGFRLMMDGKQKMDLPKNQSLIERFVTALDLPESSKLFYELQGSGADSTANTFLTSQEDTQQETDQTPQEAPQSEPDWSFKIVLGEPSVSRTDKKLIFIYVNGRRINEYALVQAIDYGGTGYFPNGTHPVAALFLTVNPALVDFNIHPAKREARFKDIGGIHRAVSRAVRNFYKQYTISTLTSQVIDASQLQQELYKQEEEKKKESFFMDIRDSGIHKEAQADPRQEVTYSLHTQEPTLKESKDFRGMFFNDSYTHQSTDIPTTGFSTLTAIQAKESAQGVPIPEEKQETKGLLSQAEALLPDTHGQRAQEQQESPKEQLQPVQQEEQVCDADHQLPHTSKPIATEDIIYHGTALGVFLIVEYNNRLYLIDQHAAHERLLFNRFIEKAGLKQALLLPYVIETMSIADDEYLHTLVPQLIQAGFDIKDCGEGRWEIHSIPVQWQGTEADLERDILTKRIAPEELISSLAATNACRHAVMDGTVLDKDTATQLAVDTLQLTDAHCPHGRPLWVEITREQLFAGVKRT